MPTVITVGNQKGGVGKTTTAVNLAAAYSKLGYKVLLIDLDSQSDASKYLGHRRDGGLYSFDLISKYVFGEEIDYNAAIRKDSSEKLDYIPADARLDMADTVLSELPMREYAIKNILGSPVFKKYDYIFFDMSSRFASLLLNALTASDYVVIPVQPQEWSYDGIAKMISNITAVRKSSNPRLELSGILLTMCGRTVLSRSVVKAVREKYSDSVLEVEIPNLVEVPESQNARRTLVNTSFSKTGRLYVQCAKELIKRELNDKAVKIGVLIK